MKLLFLNKNEQKVLIKLLKQEIQHSGSSYYLTTILEKISSVEYEVLFSNMK